MSWLTGLWYWVRFIVAISVVTIAMGGCLDDGDDGRDGKDGADGTAGPPGEDAAARPLPTLQGHIPDDPEANFHGFEGSWNLDEDRILPYDVQAAYNDDTFFWRLSYNGEEGKRHQYLRYTNGVWNKEGGDRRDAQASIDGDATQGDTDILTTIYEQRTSIMVNDPGAVTDVTNFGNFGCFLACHNGSRHMPEWVSADGHDGKYIDPDQAPGVASGDIVLDLWHWRGARSNPIGRSDDQNILALSFVGGDGNGSDNGGRKGDAGQSVFFNQGLDGDGNPQFLLDPGTTAGKFAFKWENFWTTPFFYMTQADAAELGPLAPNPGIMAYADTVARGYSPVEGDTVPRRILRAGEGSRADITAYGTTFTPRTPDSSFGLWNVQLQRSMDTGNADDIAMVEGNVYEAGFEVHLWEYTTRDHYVSFPMTVSVGTGLGADIEAVEVDAGGPESAFDINWDAIPKTRLYLFQPGITTWEFVTGNNVGKEYINAQAQLIDQTHGGSVEVNLGTACVSCHTVRAGQPDPPMGNFGTMEALTEQRGGIWENTPVILAEGEEPPPEEPPTEGSFAAGQTKYDAACAACHAAGTHDTDGFAGDIAGHADDLVNDLGTIDVGMTGILLTDQEILDLTAFLDDPSIQP